MKSTRNAFLTLVILFASQKVIAQNPVNWTASQLMQPSELSGDINANKNVPVIFNVGPGAVIPHSKDMGMLKDAGNLQKFKDELSKLPKDTSVVVYCGCCPYEHCPNVRPAIQALKDLGFTNYKLLDLPHNIKIDWINKGFPTQTLK